MRNITFIGIITLMTAFYSCADNENADINTDQPSVNIHKKVYEESEDGEGIEWPEFQSPK